MNESIDVIHLALSGGRPAVFEIRYDQYPENPETWQEQHGSFLHYHGGDEWPWYLADARDKWVNLYGRDGWSVNAAELLRYARIFHSDKVRVIAAVTQDRDGSMGIDFAPDRGAWYVGIVLIEHDDVARVWPGGATDDQVRSLLTQRVKEYGAWASGEVFVVRTMTFSSVGLDEPDEMLDACGGYYDIEHARQAATDLNPGAVKITEQEYKVIVEAARQRRAAVDTQALDAQIADASGEVSALRAQRDALIDGQLSWT